MGCARIELAPVFPLTFALTFAHVDQEFSRSHSCFKAKAGASAGK
jgi:hypothetical protein